MDDFEPEYIQKNRELTVELDRLREAAKAVLFDHACAIVVATDDLDEEAKDQCKELNRSLAKALKLSEDEERALKNILEVDY